MEKQVQNILEYITEKILIFDGGMGRELQKKGLSDEQPPEVWNIENPDPVRLLHREYFNAGAVAVTTNTFGGNRIKLSHYGLSHRTVELNERAVHLVREAVGEKGYVVGSIGPTGCFVEPLGELSFAAAYEVFFEQAKALSEAGADAIIIETMSDLGEIRAALMAAKDACSLPVIACMTYSEGNRTFTGTDPETAAVVLESLGADVIGVNCSGGPEQLEPVVATLCRSTNLPVLAEPNAGMPELENGRTVYGETPQSMAEYSLHFASLGAVMIGSCCGSTPEHTKAIAAILKGQTPVRRNRQFPLRVTGRFQTVSIGQGCYPVIIGERINPTGKKELAEEIREGKTALLKSEALSQVNAGADILDINVAVPGTDEAAAMAEAITAVQNLVQVPLCLDSPNPAALEAGLKKYHGKALVNSVNAEDSVLDKVLPIVKRYGAAVVALCMDEKGIPETAEGRIAAARKILQRAQEFGIARENIIIDCLTLTASTDSSAPRITLSSVERVHELLKLPTVLGVSNISFGLPCRPSLNSAFLSASISRGLDAAIINPLDSRMTDAFRASAVISGRDPGAQKYIADCGVRSSGETSANEPKQPPSGYHPLTELVVRGDKESIVSLIDRYLQEGLKPFALLNDYLLPGIEIVGEKYGQGEYFLPQLMLSADTMQRAFERLKPELSNSGDAGEKNTVILATVKGDIHDIGKNIVSVMLRNHGFDVVDLGKNVGNAEIIEAANQYRAKIIGLSALMTTTMPRMEEIIARIHGQNLPFKVIVGGAAVTEGYAREIGADGYGQDAVAAVEIVKKLCGA